MATFEQDAHTAVEVPCPWCGAKGGEPCHSWLRRPRPEPHVDRLIEVAVLLERD
jgi:hypothetical protein